MTTTAALQPATARSRPDRWRLSARGRKAVLLVHIVAAGAWIGIDVVIAVLVATAWSSADATATAAVYQVLQTVAVWPMAVSGLVCLASGVVLGVGTKYGLVRYWWVAVKLVMNVALLVLVLVLLRPGVAEVAEHGRALAAGLASDTDVTFLFFPPTVSLTALLVATTLSVFKPWGRTRRGRRFT